MAVGPFGARLYAVWNNELEGQTTCASRPRKGYRKKHWIQVLCWGMEPSNPKACPRMHRGRTGAKLCCRADVAERSNGQQPTWKDASLCCSIMVMGVSRWHHPISPERQYQRTWPMSRMLNPNWRARANVVNAWIEPVTDDFGQVKSGFIEIEVLALDGFRAIPLPEPASPSTRNKFDIASGPQYCALVNNQRPALADLERYSDGCCDSDVCFDAVEVVSQREFSCLLMSENHAGIAYGFDWHYNCMVAARDDNEGKSYRRIDWAWLGDGYTGCFQGGEKRTIRVY